MLRAGGRWRPPADATLSLWRFLSAATCDNPALWLERFGADDAPAVYVTAFNPTAQPQSGLLQWRAFRAPAPAKITLEELITARPVEFSAVSGSWPCALQPEQVAIFKITSQP